MLLVKRVWINLYLEKGLRKMHQVLLLLATLLLSSSPLLAAQITFGPSTQDVTFTKNGSGLTVTAGICKKFSPPPFFAFVIVFLAFACGLYIEWIGWMRALARRDRRGFVIIAAGSIGIAIGLYGLSFDWWDACFWKQII